MHWTAFWANATSGASSCEAQSCKCSNEQWLDLFQETKKRKQNLGLLTCLPAILLLSNANYWKKLLESISSIWICTSLKSFTLLFVFLCSTTLELADLANCMYLYFFLYFSTLLWSWLMWLIETRLRAKSVAILHLAFPLRYFQMALLKAALIISSEDFEKIKTLLQQRFFAWSTITICKIRLCENAPSANYLMESVTTTAPHLLFTIVLLRRKEHSINYEMGSVTKYNSARVYN